MPLGGHESDRCYLGMGRPANVGRGERVKPYFRDGAVTIYHGDCREILPDLEPVDLVLTDPPFFLPAEHFQSRVRWQRSWGDVSILGTFWDAVLRLLLPCLKTTGHLLTLCNGDSYPVFYPEMYRHFDTLKCLVWDKGHVGLGRIWRHQHELIIAGRWHESHVAINGELYADVITASATSSTDLGRKAIGIEIEERYCEIAARRMAQAVLL